MYNKDLTEDLRLRLSTTDMDFLRNLSNKRAVSVSEVIRSIIGEYRRAMDSMEVLKKAFEVIDKNGGIAVHGNTETDIDNKL